MEDGHHPGARCRAVMLAAPASPMQAAMKAGVHAHMPWSFQLMEAYPQISSMARLFFTISRMIGRAVARRGSAISVSLRVSQPRSQPASGPIQVNRKQRLYPPMGSVAPLMPSGTHSRATKPAMKSPTAMPRLVAAYWSAITIMPVVYVPPRVMPTSVWRTRPDVKSRAKKAKPSAEIPLTNMEQR